MFKNRALQVQMVDIRKQPQAADEKKDSKPNPIDQINKIVKENAKSAALLVGGLYAAKKIVDTASEVVIITANAKIR